MNQKIKETDSGYENDGFEKDILTYKESKKMTKQLTIQQVVDYLGNNIIDKKLLGSVTKGIGEVKINETMYQIHLTLEPEGGKWIEGNGIFTFKKLSWKQKIINLFTFTTDAGIQK